MRTMRRRGWVLGFVFSAWLIAACGSKGSGTGWRPGQPLTVQVGGAFEAGAHLRDAYTGKTASVNAKGEVTIEPDAAGIALLERDGTSGTPFRWKNATVYFTVTDRFFDGDPSNDHAYGRRADGAQEIGTWHGGDLAGLRQKLEHLAALGVTALWISPPVEQVHGWVAGGGGTFKHHAYHGYWALDFTRLDASFGTEAELRALVDAAHALGIRVLFDVVMNHPGYATGADLLAYLPEVFQDGTGAAFQAFDATATGNFGAWNSLVNYQSLAWLDWWGPSWIRAGFPQYSTCGSVYPPGPPCTELTTQLASLPDFITEGTQAAGLPVLFTRKTDTAAAEIPGFTVRQYLVKWHTDWVRQYGIDGFRCDTAKNVELASWKALKDAGTAALAEWKAANPGKLPDDVPFWTVGEVFPHGVTKDAYFTDGGFDALLNFELQSQVASLVEAGALAGQAAGLEALYAGMSAKLAPAPGFDVLSYLSSHDTSLFYETVGADPARQRDAGTALLLAPGAVQIFYGDESGRRAGPTGGDAAQGTRSDMNWASLDATILAHWQKLGTFRRRHAAIGAGTHQRLDAPAGVYAFSRTLAGDAPDAVVVVIAPRG